MPSAFQTNDDDCGVYAIAYITVIAFGQDQSRIIFNDQLLISNSRSSSKNDHFYLIFISGQPHGFGSVASRNHSGDWAPNAASTADPPS